MTLTVMRQIRFCAGHRLMNHEGKCANLHGHNYLAQIYVAGNSTDDVGRVIDFSVINKLFKGWIDEHWDHSMLIWTQDEDAVAAISQLGQHRLFCMPYNPTAENMAKYLLTEVAPRLLAEISDYDVHVSKVVIWETENSAAEVTLDSNSANGVACTTINSATN